MNVPWAINVEGETIWMVYDSNADQATRLLRLASGDDPTTWTAPDVATCDGLLLDAGTAVIVAFDIEGADLAAPKHTARFALRDASIELIGAVEARLPAARPDRRLVGRGSALWVQDHHVWKRAVPVHTEVG